eukprot:s2077_g11.t1
MSKFLGSCLFLCKSKKSQIRGEGAQCVSQGVRQLSCRWRADGAARLLRRSSRWGSPRSPSSRGGGPSERRVSIVSLESHARPSSRDGPVQGSQQRSAPSTARVQRVQTGAPRPAITSYASGPRPGSRGAGGGAVPPAGGEVALGPGGWQKPVVRPALQPKSGKAAAPAGYAGFSGRARAQDVV